jgi:hypothetical protein
MIVIILKRTYNYTNFAQITHDITETGRKIRVIS